MSRCPGRRGAPAGTLRPATYTATITPAASGTVTVTSRPARRRTAPATRARRPTTAKPPSGWSATVSSRAIAPRRRRPARGGC